MSTRFIPARCVLALAMLSAVTSLHAGGFDVPVMAAGMQGTSNANSAEARDPSVIYYNPAGISHLRGTWISNSFNLITVTGKVENQGTTGTPPPSNTDNSDSNPGELIEGGGPGTYWPKILGSAALFASTPWNDSITLGFGLFPVAGGNLNNKKDWFGRNFADSTAVEIINANPVAAIRFDDKHSLGIGGSVLLGHLKQKLQIDIPGVAPYLLQPVLDDVGAGTVGSLVNGLLDNLSLGQLLNTGLLPPALTNTLTQSGLSLDTIFDLLPAGLQGSIKGEIAKLGGEILLTEDSNGSGTLELFGYGFGWNVGYMFSPSERTRIGLSYRAKSRLQMRGKLDWDVEDVHGLTDNIPGIMGLPAPDGSGNVSASDFLALYYRPDATIKSDIVIPARLSLGVFHQLSERIDLMFDYTFIQSSAVKSIIVDILDEPAPNGVDKVSQAPGVILANWRDSFTASLGMNYRWNDKLTLRTGYKFDLTPIRSPEYRHPSAPDSNRHMFSIGANYKLRKHMSVDLAYSLIMLEDAESRYRDPCRGAFLEDEDGFTSDKPQDCTGNGGTFRGKFQDTFINTIGVQLNTRM